LFAFHFSYFDFVVFLNERKKFKNFIFILGFKKGIKIKGKFKRLQQFPVKIFMWCLAH